MNWALIVPVIVALLGGAGLTQIVAAVSRRRVTSAEAEQMAVATGAKVNEIALQVLAEVRRDAQDARREANEARRESLETARQMRALSAEAEALGIRMRQLRLAILSPSASLEQLRLMVAAEPLEEL